MQWEAQPSNLLKPPRRMSRASYLWQVTPDGMAANPLQALPAAEREVAAIIAFAARYYSGLPFEVRVGRPRASVAVSARRIQLHLHGRATATPPHAAHAAQTTDTCCLKHVAPDAFPTEAKFWDLNPDLSRLSTLSLTVHHNLRSDPSLTLQDPATVFLKEFLPDTRPVAMNELQTLRHLQGHLPLRKWHAATAAVTTGQPFVPLLGVHECTGR